MAKGGKAVARADAPVDRNGPAGAEHELEEEDDRVLGLPRPVVDAILFLFTFGLYLNSLKAGFVFDDLVAVVQNKVAAPKLAAPPTRRAGH